MISQTKNRVQAIKSKFENLNNDSHVTNNFDNNSKPALQHNKAVFVRSFTNSDKENVNNNENCNETTADCDTANGWAVEPNLSYLYSKNDLKRSTSDTKKSLVRQSSDPGKKLHRSHAFRCDRSKIVSPKRHGSCNGRSETSDFGLKMGEKRLSKDRLKRLGNLLEDQMKKEGFVVQNNDETIVGHVVEVNGCQPLSVPDSEVPQHILDQYAKVVKPKKSDNDKQDGMTDSGVSSETENLEDEKTNRVKRLLNQFEKSESAEECSGNLSSMNDLCASSETMRLEKKNPHLKLTDTLKKALKQPLPPGPPPKKPPRTFTVQTIQECPEKEKKDAKKMLEKLELVLQKRESQSSQSLNRSESDSVESNQKKPKEIHYLCTEILDIAHKTLLPNTTGCFKSLNCAITNNSTLSLPYTRLSTQRQSLCSCSNDNLNKDQVLTTFFTQKCAKCQNNDSKDGQFKCHLQCKCNGENSQFFVDEHIYDEPFVGEATATIGRLSQRSKYGSLNFSKSLEDLRCEKLAEDQKIYDIPCDISRPETPEEAETTETISPETEETVPIEAKETAFENETKTDFERLRRNFENGFKSDGGTAKKDLSRITKNKVNNNVKDRRSNFDGDTRNKDANHKIVTKVDLDLKFKDRTSFSDVDEDRLIFNDAKSRISLNKPPMRPKPVFVKNRTRSSENILEETDRVSERKFASEGRRYRKERDANSGRLSLQKKDSNQLDVDRENLNRLMNEIYETVTAVTMADNRPGSFPTDTSDGSTSEDSVKLTRSLTEKRKNYVRRVSSRVAYLDPKLTKNIRYRHQTSVCSYKSDVVDNPYSTFRSWKSFRTSQNNLAKMDAATPDSPEVTAVNVKRQLSMSTSNEFDSSDVVDSESIDEKTGCVDIELPFVPRERGLFNVCMLVGLNYMTGQAYVKSVFPSQVQVPPHIENLVFPETLSPSTDSTMGVNTQCYSMVLTDEKGERSYGYCRRVLPEGATTCLPLCYCLIGKYRAPGFYYKILQEIETHHGSSEVEIHSILQQLFEADFPHPGEEITITYSKNMPQVDKTNRHSTYIDKCKTLPDLRRSVSHSDQKCRSEKSDQKCKSDKSDRSDKSDQSDKCNSLSANKVVSDYAMDCSELEYNNNDTKKVFLCFDSPKLKTIKRSIEPRVDEDNLSTLIDSLGAGLTIKVFGTLLLERKVVIMGDQLSQISSCLEALQSSLYPFVWQQPLISMVPAEIRREVLDAPLPLLAGSLSGPTANALQEGMLLDLSLSSKVLVYQGDESTIMPTSSYKTLKTTLHLESKREKEDKSMRNVMISEGFLRFFVDILGDFWKYFSPGELKEGALGKDNVVFDKESFVRSAPSKQNQYFLEWFTETAMFNHFIQNMALCYNEPRYCDIFIHQNGDLDDKNSLGDRKNSLEDDRNSCSDRKKSPENRSLNSDCQNDSDFLTSEVWSGPKFVDAPLPNFYDLFLDRVRAVAKTDLQKLDKLNYKSAMNKRMKILKTKLKELVT